MNPVLPHRALYVAGLVIIAAAYATLARIVLTHFSANGVITVVWPSSGVAVAALLIGGSRYWPGILAGALITALMADNTLVAAIGIACGNLMEAMTCVYLLRQVQFNQTLLSPRDYYRLLFCGSVSALVSALTGTGVLLATNFLSFDDLGISLLNWWQGNALGIVLVTPLVLIWQHLPARWREVRFVAEAIACLALTAAFGHVALVGAAPQIAGFELKPYWSFLFLTWAALRLGRHGALVVIFVLTVQGLYGAVQGNGLFASDFRDANLAGFWFYVLTLAIVGITVSLILQEQIAAKLQESARARAMTLIATGAPLSQILHGIARDIESANPGMLCSVLLLDEQGKHLLYGAAPSLPDFYNQAIHGVAIGPAVGSCGTAAYIGERVIASDIQHDPLWLDYRDLAAQAGVNACWSEPVRGKGGQVLGTFGIYHRQAHSPTAADIDTIVAAAHLVAIAIERTRSEEQLRLAATVYQHSSEAIMVFDTLQHIVAINPAFSALTGYHEQEIIGQRADLLNTPDHEPAFSHAFWQQIRESGHWAGEIWTRRKNGDTFALSMSLDTIRGEDGEVQHYVALFSDITAKKQSEAMIWRQANFDALTQLPNRSMFLDRLEQEIKKDKRSDDMFALLFIDLDRFKEVNDTLGHPMGDLLLMEAAQRITQSVRESDTVARLGGDEFTVILTGIDDPGDVEHIMQHMIGVLAAPYELGSESVFVSASIGVTFYPTDTTDMEDLLKYADQAMYAAKSAGRNRYSFFTASLQIAADTRRRLTIDLRRALNDKQFEVYYQPIVELATGNVYKAEALLRWKHPERGMISPADFIPIAEETGLIVDIGDWVFRTAARQAKTWRERVHPQFQISVNKSPVQFHNTENQSNSAWIAYLKTLDLPGNGIAVEITEGLLLDNAPIVTDKLLSFRDASIQVALDDFGTGYSALSYLKKFDIDYLKIDRAFVSNLETSSDDVVLCEAIVVMAHKLGIKVIAEGVETQAQSDILTRAGCDFGQGYLFSKPVSADDFETRFARR